MKGNIDLQRERRTLHTLTSKNMNDVSGYADLYSLARAGLAWSYYINHNF